MYTLHLYPIDINALFKLKYTTNNRIIYITYIIANDNMGKDLGNTINKKTTPKLIFILKYK